MADDESLQELRDSIQAFERARESRQRKGDAPAVERAAAPARRRWLPVVVLGVGLCAVAIVLMGGGPTESVSDGATTASDEPAPPAERTTSPRPVTPGAATALNSPGAAAEPIAASATAPSSDDTPSDDAPATEAETARPETGTAPASREAPVVPSAGAVPAEPEQGSSEETGSAVRPAQPGRFAIQVAAYDREPQATALATRLTAKNYPAYVAESRDLEGRTVFRVRVGGYPERADAEETGRQIATDEGLDWYLLQAP